MARVAVLVCSDKGAAGLRTDESGARVAALCAENGHEVTKSAVVADDKATIAAMLTEWCDAHVADVIVTTGGTGLTTRDVTPEATRSVAERDVPGIPVALALRGLEQTPLAVLSRGVAVTRGKTLIVNLPGSPSGVEDGMGVLIPMFSHVAALLAGPVEHSGEDGPANDAP